ncbi:iron siderophore-binding protein, partial [Burkholderia thailandensis]|nr:iron siderophore-binding protein [Burkholderia thailandensis]
MPIGGRAAAFVRAMRATRAGLVMPVTRAWRLPPPSRTARGARAAHSR